MQRDIPRRGAHCVLAVGNGGQTDVLAAHDDEDPAVDVDMLDALLESDERHLPEVIDQVVAEFRRVLDRELPAVKRAVTGES